VHSYRHAEDHAKALPLLQLCRTYSKKGSQATSVKREIKAVASKLFGNFSSQTMQRYDVFFDYARNKDIFFGSCVFIVIFAI